MTALSAAAGLPGGITMVATIPADAAQYFAHVIRVAQKLAYLYDWPELFEDSPYGMNDVTKNILTLFVGVMFGVNTANNGLRALSAKIATQTAKQLPQQALTKGVIYPIVKSVARRLGIQMSKTIFANAVAKAVPLVGAVISGGVTAATFVPMSYRLKKHLSTSYRVQQHGDDGSASPSSL
ncbi:MAG: hypothetical protein HY996_01330 [Micrococcales bacterium]|nr:hypothetical protein [Micrococcales bacterium]